MSRKMSLPPRLGWLIFRHNRLIQIFTKRKEIPTNNNRNRSDPYQNLRSAIATYPNGRTTSESLSVFGALKPSESERWD